MRSAARADAGAGAAFRRQRPGWHLPAGSCRSERVQPLAPGERGHLADATLVAFKFCSAMPISGTRDSMRARRRPTQPKTSAPSQGDKNLQAQAEAPSSQEAPIIGRRPTLTWRAVRWIAARRERRSQAFVDLVESDRPVHTSVQAQRELARAITQTEALAGRDPNGYLRASRSRKPF